MRGKRWKLIHFWQQPPQQQEWELPFPRAGAQGAVIGQQLYIPGGAGALVFEPTSTVLRFSLLDALPR